MPWEVISQMDLKIKFINDWNNGRSSITDLSHKYRVSLPTIYKWLAHYKFSGIEGLKEKSRVPNRCPHRTSKEILDIVIQEKLKNRNRGPRKVRAQLKRQHPEIELPAVSTISYWLKKEGLVESRKKRRRVLHPIMSPFPDAKLPIMYGALTIKGNSICKTVRFVIRLRSAIISAAIF